MRCTGQASAGRAQRIVVLPLVAIALRGKHQPLGDRIGARHTEIAAHDVQQQIDPRRRTRGRQDIAAVRVEHILDHRDLRITPGEQRGVAPMGRGPTPVQKTQFRQQEGTRTDRHEPRPARMGSAAGGGNGRGDSAVPGRPAGDDDDVCALDQSEVAIDRQLPPLPGADRPAIL